MAIVSVVYSIVFSANPVKPYVRCVRLIGGVSGWFSLAMGILAGFSLPKLRTMARPNWSDLPLKRTNKVQLVQLVIKTSGSIQLEKSALQS